MYSRAVMTEYHRAAYHREHRFHAEQQGDDGRVAVALGDDLQKIRNAAGEYRNVEYRQGEAGDRRPIGALEYELPYERQRRGGQEFGNAEADGIEASGKAVDEEYLHGEGHSADEGQQIARGKAEPAAYAKQVKARHRDGQSSPDHAGDPPSQNAAGDRHQHHIKRGDKARLARVGARLHARLLEIGGHGKRRAAKHARDHERLKAALLRGSGDALGLFAPEEL